jgi:hypothetical protein
MRKVFKYPIEGTDMQTVICQCPLRVIHAGLDPQGTACIWVEVNTVFRSMAPVTIWIVGTGSPIPAQAVRHIGSFNQGPFVWHVYTQEA